MTSVRRGLALALAERYALIVIALASNMLLARLLTPKEIGIYSVSLAIIGVAQVLRDFGIGSYLIQAKDLEESHIRTAYGLSLIMGVSLFVVVFLVAPWASRFYAEPRLLYTLRINSLNFLVLPFCTISLSLLRREMRFDRVAIVTLVATAAGAGVTLALAYLGFGANSLAVGGVATNILTGLGAWLARAERRLVWPSLTQWRPLLNFGGQSALAGVVTSVAMDINDLALGRILGFAPVAIMSRAQGLMNLFHRDVMGAIRSVAFPAFAMTHREGQGLESSYVRAVGAVTVFAWPFYGFVSLYALEATRLLFGNQWDEVARLAPIFCLAGAVGATCNLVLSAITAAGRIDLVTKAELLFQPVRATMIVVAALVCRSLTACAVAYLLAFIFHVPLLYWFKGRCIKNDWRPLFAQLVSSLKVVIATLALPAALSIYGGLTRTEPVGSTVFAAAGIMAVVAWLFAAARCRHSVSADPLFGRLWDKVPGFFKEAR